MLVFSLSGQSKTANILFAELAERYMKVFAIHVNEQAAPYALDKENAKKLWVLSEEIV
ncbi:hypothetical protein C0991_011623, partial [Blastosporella zonata]